MASAPAPWQGLITEWAMPLEAENKSPRTIRDYTDVVRKFHVWLAAPAAPPSAPEAETWLASVPAAPADPAEYRPAHIKRWLAFRLATTSPGNADNNYRALRSWFNRLLDEEELQAHPMARMKPPHVPRNPSR